VSSLAPILSRRPQRRGIFPAVRTIAVARSGAEGVADYELRDDRDSAPNAGPTTKLGVVGEQPPVPRAGILIGYARCSTEKQDPSAQRQIPRELGVAEDRIYLDQGLTGRKRSRPGLDNALAALCEGARWSCPQGAAPVTGLSPVIALGPLAAR
jgi:hypothetical protein